MTAPSGFTDPPPASRNQASTAVPARRRRVTHHPATPFVPEPVTEALHTVEQGERLDRVKEWLRVVAFLEMIIGNAGAQVMNMVEANIAGKPL